MLDTWVDSSNKTAWDYIGIIDATTNSSRVDIFRYEDQFVETHPFPVIHANPEWSHEVAVDQAWGDNIEQALHPLIEFMEETVPAPQLERTPIYFYGSGHFRSLDLKNRHNVLRTACDYVMAHSKALLSDCGKHVSYIEAHQQATLNWLAANYQANTLDAPERAFGVVDISAFGVHVAYHAVNEQAKSKLFRAGLRAANGTAVYTDLHADYYDLVASLSAEQLAHCIPQDSYYWGVEGSGSFAECQAALDGLFGPLVEAVQSRTEPLTLHMVGGVDALRSKFKWDKSAVEAFCNTGVSDANVPATACLEASLALFITEKIGTLSDVTVLPSKDDDTQSDISGEWPLGRALLYADVDLSKNGGQSIGIHENVGSPSWAFGQSDTVARPRLAAPGDWTSRFGSKAHRLWGGIVLLLGLAGILLLLLGKAGRSRIWAAITRTPKPPGWRKVATSQDEPVYELDDVAIEDEGEDEFDV